jgi:hypothetical protein
MVRGVLVTCAPLDSQPPDTPTFPFSLTRSSSKTPHFLSGEVKDADEEEEQDANQGEGVGDVTEMQNT